MQEPIIEIDVHGCDVSEAIRRIRREVNRADRAVYRIRVIHGYHGGNRIKNAIRDEFYYLKDAKVKNVVAGSNQGITELVLREY